MRTRTSFMFLIVSGAFLFAFTNGNSDETATKKDVWRAPVETKKLANPTKGKADALAAGKHLFAQQCTPCHGALGKGDGPASQFLGKTVPNLTKADFQKQADGEIFWKMSNGKTPMPAFNTILSDEQRWQIITYIRSLDKSKK